MAQNLDLWSGTYFLKDADLIVMDTIKIAKTNELIREKLPDRLQIDLKRWNISSQRDHHKDMIEARNFIFQDADHRNEYEEFGWKEMHQKGEMHCLDAGHLFLCQTKPESKVFIGKDESFYSESGIFGIRLHYGLFKLEKIKEEMEVK